VLLVIVGATGTGKSELSLDVAERVMALGTKAEIVNADAMQLYRGMDIGTAKLSITERRSIPHHLLDTLSPRQEASVSDYQLQARLAIDDIAARGAIPILVGGSGLYVSSVIQDFQFPGTDPVIRARWEERLRVEGPGTLHRLLLERDPLAAASIGSSNGRRIVRALEVIELTGEPFGTGLPEYSAPWREHVTIGLQSPREQLVERLQLRVERMWEEGLVEEVERLRPDGFGVTAGRAIGYAQVISQLDGEVSSVQAIEQTAALTRRYARRQVGWFRRYRDAHWFDATDPVQREFAIALAVGKS
jgi:tRNA dimethylallyltransferase